MYSTYIQHLLFTDCETTCTKNLYIVKWFLITPIHIKFIDDYT
jgi:hypothetical protein